MARTGRQVTALLFDLDGTLVDTAPDLALALNRLREENGSAPLPYSEIRPCVSIGSSALVRLGFPHIDSDSPHFDRLRARYLELYAADLLVESRLFPGMERVLKEAVAAALPWGIVTNKPAFLTDPLVAKMGLDTPCVVSGDTTDQRKPHPKPMWHASELLGVEASGCLYVGDAERDIQAGRAAGMTTLGARFGYIEPGSDPEQWGADGLIDHPHEILEWIGAA